jgi:hypothetical protein
MIVDLFNASKNSHWDEMWSKPFDKPELL